VSDAPSDTAVIVDAGIAERNRDRDAAVAALWREHGPAGIAAVLDERLRVITAAHQGREIQGMGELVAGLGAARPAAISDLVAEAVALPDGPMDLFLDALLNAWAESDTDAFAAALPGLVAARPGVASAVVHGFRVHRWAGLHPQLAQVHREALADTGPQLRGQWLAAAGEMLRSDPVAAVPLIIDAAAGAPWGIAQALEAASHYDPDGWSATLKEGQGLAVLALARICGWQTWAVQRIISGIARAQPRAVLDALAEDSADQAAVDEVSGLPEALAGHPDVLADWLSHLLLAGQDEWRIAALLPLVLGEPFTDAAATAVADVATAAGSDDLLRLVRMLRFCHGFTVAHPDLAVALLVRAEAMLDGEALMEVERRLVAAAAPDGARWSPTPTNDIQVSWRDRALQLAQDMTRSESVRTIFSASAAAIQAVIDEEARPWRDDED
jgi:hypothetical protein